MRILLVEDHPMNLDFLLRCLQREGYEVLTAIDGPAALDRARAPETTPDVILMDLGLPDLDGWEATRRLKADDATRKIPVIALTAHAMPGDEQSALEAGCDDYASKPIDVPKLVEKIRRLCPDH
jgi:CheY-like chemotaxis protein